MKNSAPPNREPDRRETGTARNYAREWVSCPLFPPIIVSHFRGSLQFPVPGFLLTRRLFLIWRLRSLHQPLGQLDAPIHNGEIYDSYWQQASVREICIGPGNIVDKRALKSAHNSDGCPEPAATSQVPTHPDDKNDYSSACPSTQASLPVTKKCKQQHHRRCEQHRNQSVFPR